ncbi:TPA: D-glycero-beta-D-manno-heptose 1-phosphate adenylyltransferase [Candidatus Dependentiae bacterium]|nr:MAG: Bifunctional protein HldE [candidate division TM6 bacterium GW2011_GWE2_31_21]KKP53890.1 MAG: Bifunctional protein HldE [candidate division TM6 bacterium GW2011_GWF2_33_332]HBS47670.1 D-glycero-beta-D-manno-heptose 1-phosphate adenylyltransferase [Candidatus Dependentiae bacterium]HBZ73819.1 D-glycero-beta-D-manno-heptose 1-phosphate adenylyltransferase [Candidatus Dependentiae bacterium]
MKNIIQELKNAKNRDVLIIGDLMLDEYVFGSVSRISPEAPVPILKEERKEWSLGGAANVALNCKKIGCDVSLVGIVNETDRAGSILLSMLDAKNLKDAIIKSFYRPTTLKQRLMAQNHQLMRVDAEDSKTLSRSEKNDIFEKVAKILKPNSIIIISDYAKGIIDEELITFVNLQAKKNNSIVLVDPKGPNFSKYKNLNFIKPNLKEFKEMVNFFKLPAENSILENGKKICDLLSIDGLFVTLGDKGISFISKNDHIFSPALGKKEVFDLTGAGDTVISFLALGLLNHLPIDKCLEVANLAAAVAISHLKTYAVSLEELFDKNIQFQEKFIFDWRNLKTELDWHKIEGKKIVFTNGCFDLLHSGHVALLSEAKKCGDILVVAMNSDESIKRIKGDDRPIQNLSDRAKVMSALGFVDFVTVFDEETPANLISFLKPDVLAKGGDYAAETVVGYDFITSYGGEVKIINHDFTHDKGFSTTQLAKRVKGEIEDSVK